MRFLSYPDLRARGIPYSKMHLGRLMRAGKFPRSVKLTDAQNSPNLWHEDEVDALLVERVHARDSATPEAA
jgi:prophage regulatory protein